MLKQQWSTCRCVIIVLACHSCFGRYLFTAYILLPDKEDDNMRGLIVMSLAWAILAAVSVTTVRGIYHKLE